MAKKQKGTSRYRLRWKDHFSFTVQETKGLYLLLGLLSLEVSYLYYLRNFSRPALPSGWEKLAIIADSVTARMQADHPHRREHSSDKTGRGGDTLYKFDPNSIGKHGWMKLGLSSRQADAVLAYRSKSGGFRDKSELSHVKVISPELLQRWDGFVALPDSSVSSATPRKTVVADVNLSDSSAFDRIRGIGPSLAGRIVRYRERLGGFRYPEQVREVYGVSDSLWQILSPRLVISPNPVLRLLDLNTADADSLKAHPYIGYRIAVQILNYRRQHLFRSVDELKRLPLVSEEIYRKLAPYLKTGD